jgi:hypothetical protein
MNDDFEDLLKRWLRERGATDRSAIRALAGNVAVLPPRRRRGLSPLASAAVVLVALALGAVILAPRFGSVGGPAGAPTWNKELARCGASLETAFAVFSMDRARDYRLHLPAMLLAPELDVDDPAFVVVYAAMQPFGGGGAAPPPGQTFTPRTLDPGHHDVCILVGYDAATAELNIYENVDTTGLREAVESGEPLGSPGPTTSTEEPPGGTTPEPGPPWAGDLLGQLQCDGPPQAIGGEVGDLQPIGGTGTASPYAWLYAEDVADLPLEGWTEDPKVAWEIGASDFVRYVNEVDGRAKAIIVMGGHSTNGGVGHWQIVAFRACPSDEYDPLRGRTTDDAPWTDASGLETSEVTTIVGPSHCGWESTVWLRLADRLYLRDPLRVLAQYWVGDYLPSTTLPADATDTGFRSRDWELFTTPSQDFVYVRTPAGVERWPRSKDPYLGCA